MKKSINEISQQTTKIKGYIIRFLVNLVSSSYYLFNNPSLYSTDLILITVNPIRVQDVMIAIDTGM